MEANDKAFKAITKAAEEIEGKADLLEAAVKELRAEAERLRFVAITFDPTMFEEELSRSCTGKRRYRSEQGAGEAAKGAQLRDPNTPIRIYKCVFCDQFHLTSTPLETFVRRTNITRGLG